MEKTKFRWNRKLHFGVGATIAEGLLSGCNFILLYRVMEGLTGGKFRMQTVLTSALILAVIYLIRLFIYSIGYVQGQIGGAAVSKQLRLVLGDKMKQIPLARFTRGQIGQYINTVTSDVNNYQKILTHKVGDLAKNISLSLIMIIFAGTIYLPAGIILLCSDLLLVPGLGVSFSMVKKYGNRKNAISAEAVSSIVEYIGGIQTFRAYGAGGVKNKAATKAMHDFSNISYLYERKIIPVGMVLNVCNWCSLPLIIWVSSQAWIKGSLDTISFLLLCLLPLVMAKLAGTIFIDLTSFKHLTISRRKIEAILSEPEETGSMEPPAIKTHDITFHKVEFSYVREEPVLKGMDFTAANQKLTAIVGDSGSGKSTILNLISKYYDAASGTVCIGGKPVAGIAAERVLEQISMVDQDIFLFDDTVRNNIRYARPSATDQEIEAACREANCDEFIRRMEKGYDTSIGENGNHLSGGERQRLSIARAILKDAPILLLDEATASLDIENELAVKQAVMNLLKKKKTVIMIAHTLSVIEYADEILVVEDGKITERGKHEDLLHMNGKYASMWKAERRLSA